MGERERVQFPDSPAINVFDQEAASRDGRSIKKSTPLKRGEGRESVRGERKMLLDFTLSLETLFLFGTC